MLDGPLRDELTTVEQSVLEQPAATDGYVEFFGRLDGGDWLIGGWARGRWGDRTRRAVTLRFQQDALTGHATTCFFGRNDLCAGATGFMMLLRAGTAPAGPLDAVTVDVPDRTLRLVPAASTLPLPASRLRDVAGRLATEVGSAQAHTFHRVWIDPPPLPGRDQPGDQGFPVRVVVEAVFTTPPSGLILAGWLDDPGACVDGLYVRQGARVMALDETTWLRLPRQDVNAASHPDNACEGQDRGFLAYLPDLDVSDRHVPHGPMSAAPLGIQVACLDGTVRVMPLPPPMTGRVDAVRHILGGIHLHPAALSRAMGTILGPMLAALEAPSRCARPTAAQDLRYGMGPVAPRCSVIVPLSDRAEDLEWQLALLSEAAHDGVEFLYVLDRPSLAGTAERLAETCAARFGLPFRLLLLDRQIGPARCCNIAAEHAAGDMLCFLSPLAMPGHPAWLQRLMATLEATPGLGAIGGRLQQDGAAGIAPPIPNDAPPIEVATISLACLAIRRAVFRSLGGLEEAYSAGGLADTDLCRRLRRAFLHCAIHPGATITLLDRAPAPVPHWRRNLAAYSTWRYENAPATAAWPDLQPR